MPPVITTWATECEPQGMERSEGQSLCPLHLDHCPASSSRRSCPTGATLSKHCHCSISSTRENVCHPSSQRGSCGVNTSLDDCAASRSRRSCPTGATMSKHCHCSSSSTRENVCHPSSQHHNYMGLGEGVNTSLDDCAASRSSGSCPTGTTLSKHCHCSINSIREKVSTRRRNMGFLGVNTPLDDCAASSSRRSCPIGTTLSNHCHCSNSSTRENACHPSSQYGFLGGYEMTVLLPAHADRVRQEQHCLNTVTVW